MIDPTLNPGAQPNEFGRPAWVRWRILAIVMAIAFMNHFNRISMAVAGDDRIMPQYSIDPTRMGWVYSAFLIVYTLAMLPGGWLIDRYGPRVALTVMGLGTGFFCALTGAVGMLGLGSIGVWVGLLGVRGLMGLCAAPLHPAGGKAVSHWFPPGRRVLANGLVVGASSIGMALVFKVFGGMIDRIGWPLAFCITGSITALLGLVWCFYATDWPAQHPGTNAAERALIGPEHSSAMATRHRASFLPELRLVARNRSLLLLTVSYMAIGYFEYLFFYWMHYYFEDKLALGKELSRDYATMPYLAMAVTMPLGGWLADRLGGILGPRLGRAIVPAGGMLVSALGLLIGLQCADPRWIVAWFSLALGGIGAAEGPFWTTAIELGGRRGATSGAICNTAGNAAGFVAPVLTPLVGKYYGWPAAIGLGSVFCLLGMGLWIWIDPAERVKEE